VAIILRIGGSAQVFTDTVIISYIIYAM